MSGWLTVIDSVSAEPPGKTAQSSWFGWSDWAGMLASIACAIHCAAMPFVVAYLPTLGLSFLADEAFHEWMAVGCFAIALAAFIPGFNQHRRLTPVLVGSAGLVMISVAAFGFADECCASCENRSASAELAPSAVSEGTVPPTDAETCTAACCPPVTGESSAEGAAVTFVSLSSGLATSPAPWLGRVVPWLTPLGGIVLVTAHLLNRRYGCLCGCCDNESVRRGAENA
jgi:hypothetical protein